MKTEQDLPVDDAVVEERGIVLRHPSVPTTINELAALDKDQGLAIIEQRTKIFHSMRTASIALTFPNDWSLFKDPEGRITAYLGDQGCDRIKKMWGIQVNNLGTMRRIEDADHADEFAYGITGDGVCGLTGEAVFDMEGIRYSTERYATEKPEGMQRTVAVQKAARANLDGSITRELAGMKSVPAQELDKAWEGTWKKSELCNKARGFGSQVERQGGQLQQATDIPVELQPICDQCVAQNKTTNMKFVPAGKSAKGSAYEAFWSCPANREHATVKHAEILKRVSKVAERQPGDEK